LCNSNNNNTSGIRKSQRKTLQQQAKQQQRQLATTSCGTLYRPKNNKDLEKQRRQENPLANSVDNESAENAPAK